MSEPTHSLANIELSTKILLGSAFSIKTPSCIRLSAHLERWLTTGILGAVVYGWPRLGKTTATRWTLKTIKHRLGAVPWIEVSCRKQAFDSERAFFQHILKCGKNRYYKKSGTAADRRDRVTEMLRARALSSPIKTVIVFFDEAQHLRDLHYDWLVNISNELDATGVRVFVLLVGQHQMVNRKQKYIDAGVEEVVGRFMTEEWAFEGVDGPEGFLSCLKEFDASVYPEKGGKPFIEYYVPKGAKCGWRLEFIAEDFWRKFQKLWKSNGGEGDCVIPMHHVTAATINLLNLLAVDDCENLVVCDAALNLAVARSGYKNTLKALKSPMRYSVKAVNSALEEAV